MNNDSLLFRRIVKKDLEAFRAVYDTHFKFLFNYGKKLSTDDLLVEDAIQELFTDLWLKAGNYNDIDNFRKYLTIALRNRMFKVFAKNKIISHIDNIQNYDFGLELDKEQLMINSEIDAEQIKDLEIEIAKLSAKEREVIYLRFYMDMDYDAICENLNIQYQSARNLLATCMKKLKNSMSQRKICIIFIVQNYIYSLI